MDLKTKLKALNGEDLELTIGEAIATVLVNEKQDDSLRAYALAREVYDTDKKDFNTSDLDFIKNSLRKTKIFTALVAGQVLQLLEDNKK